jgi:hypothetical protein
MSNTDPETLKATAINWAKQFQTPGIPDDLSEADAVVETYLVRNRVLESSMSGANELNLDYKKYRVVLRKAWVVNLDEQGFPEGPPYRR